MMKKLFTILILFTSPAIFAQPEITQSNIPQVGDNVTIAICSNSPEPGNSGANQTWDMSGLTESEEQFFTYILPSEGIFADSFPNANLCAVSWQDDYSYYRISPDALTVEGHVVTIDTGDTSVMVFNNSEQILTLPYNLNTNFTDNFNGDLYLPGFSGLTFEGSLDFEADGYGTLILPNGTYNNVIRYHLFREQTNYFIGIPGPTQTKEQWAWVSSDYRFWLLLMEENWDGFSLQSLIWYDKNPYSATSGLSSYTQRAIIAYPNPLRSGRDLYIKWDKNEPAEISLMSLDGRLIKHQQMNLAMGSNEFDYPDLNVGTYILKVQTNERCLTQKLSVLK